MYSTILELVTRIHGLTTQPSQARNELINSFPINPDQQSVTSISIHRHSESLLPGHSPEQSIPDSIAGGPNIDATDEIGQTPGANGVDGDPVINELLNQSANELMNDITRDPDTSEGSP